MHRAGWGADRVEDSDMGGAHGSRAALTKPLGGTGRSGCRCWVSCTPHTGERLLALPGAVATRWMPWRRDQRVACMPPRVRGTDGLVWHAGSRVVKDRCVGVGVTGGVAIWPECLGVPWCPAGGTVGGAPLELHKSGSAWPSAGAAATRSWSLSRGVVPTAPWCDGCRHIYRNAHSRVRLAGRCTCLGACCVRRRYSGRRARARARPAIVCGRRRVSATLPAARRGPPLVPPARGLQHAVAAQRSQPATRSSAGAIPAAPRHKARRSPHRAGCATR